MVICFSNGWVYDCSLIVICGICTLPKDSLAFEAILQFDLNFLVFQKSTRNNFIVIIKILTCS